MGSRRVIVIAVALCVVLAGAAASSGCGTAVPDVRGKTPEQAETALTAAGFKSGRVDYDPSAQGARGAVISQDPAGGTKTNAGCIVNMTVAGERPVSVPGVVGMHRDAASAVLASQGLLVGDGLQSYSATAAAGVVMAQDPPAGERIPEGSAVDLVVSLGPQVSPPSKVTPEPAKVEVPSVKGLKLAIAKAKVEAAGLTWDHQLGDGDGMTDVGFVYKQTPAAGASVTAGSSVTLWTWKGP